MLLPETKRRTSNCKKIPRNIVLVDIRSVNLKVVGDNIVVSVLEGIEIIFAISALSRIETVRS